MKEQILNLLPGDHPWQNQIYWYDSTDSTNNLAKVAAQTGAPHGTVIFADHQTGGRGRMGRRFHSPAGCGIYMSLLLRPNCPATELMHLTCAAAVTACDAVEVATGMRPGIKWTNDLVHNRRKLGGILTELSVDASTGNVEYAIIGIGINCCQTSVDFPEEIRSFAGSLTMVTGKMTNRAKLAAALICAFSSLRLSEKSRILETYRRDCVTIGKEISLVQGDDLRHGHAFGVDNSGALLVRFPDGHTEAVHSGEVSVRGMYGYL